MHAVPSEHALPPSPISAWLPVVGVNSNVTVNGEDFHVQTEDLAPRQAQLRSHVFREGGCVVKVVRLDYSRHLDKPNRHAILTRVVKVFHAKVMRSLERQRLDSMPAVVDLRESIAPAAIATNPPPVSPPVPPPVSQITNPSPNANLTLPSWEPLVSDPPQSIGRVWDRVVEVAQKARPLLVASAHGNASHARPEDLEAPPPSSTNWDRAIENARLTARAARLDTHPVPPDPALHAHDQGLLLLRQGTVERALIELAHAVQLEPKNERYRSALRRALDAMDDLWSDFPRDSNSR